MNHKGYDIHPRINVPRSYESITEIHDSPTPKMESIQFHDRPIGSLIDFMVYGNDCIEAYERMTLKYEKTGADIIVRQRQNVYEEMKVNLQQSIHDFERNEKLNPQIEILFEKGIYDVGTNCIIRYPGDGMTVNNLYLKKLCFNNFIIITGISNEFITFSKGDKHIGTIHKSNIFPYHKLILIVVSDFYVRHLRGKIHPIDYWILAIECMRLGMKKKIYKEYAHCIIENCSDERVGHLMHNVH